VAGGIFDDWTPAQKKRWMFSGFCGLIVFVILYAIFANLFPLYFPSVDEHLGALIGAVICIPIGLWVWLAVYSRWPLPKGTTSFFKRDQRGWKGASTQISGLSLDSK
jgi:hypothetical protein